MKRIFTLFALLFFTLQANAQRRVDYGHSRWFFGLNAGAAWHTTDVRSKTNLGWGLTLGKSYNYNYGTLLSFDLRARFLTARYYGQDFKGTQNLSKNPVYSSYADSVGFGVLNFKSTIYRGALELVIHGNRFRENTGWDLSVFGGVGLTFSQAKGDLYKGGPKLENLYDYNALAQIDKSSITNLTDKDYETNLTSLKGRFAPSLGIGIGRQLSKRVYFGLEHKTTFTLDDDFDGFTGALGNDRKNDLYHYTSAYLRWYFNSARYVDPEIPQNPTNNGGSGNGNTGNNGSGNNGSGNNGNNGNTGSGNGNNTGNNLRLPIVDFTNPTRSGTTVNSPDFIIKANIQNVSDRQNIVFKQNGNFIQAFAFNATTQRLESSVYLVTGQNIFEIVASNNDGTDQESTIIIFNPQQAQVTPPRVDITNPAVSPTTVNNASFYFTANVYNVASQNEITFTVNGTVSAFSWNANTNQLTSNLNLNIGSNLVTVSASNVAGTDSETATIIYAREVQEVRPTVVFTDPSVNPYNTSIVTHAITANVFNVAGQQNITFKQNGQVNNNFTYNPTTHVLAVLVSLNPGQNIFEIIASNNAGTATASTVINYTNGTKRPPIVTITNPAFSPTTVENTNFTFAATVLNVTMSSQIVMSLNGQTITNFTFNTNTNGVTANLNLLQGTNVVVITGTNTDGSDSKQTTIIVRPAQTAQPPVVTYVTPSNSPTTVENQSYSVLANISNLTAQNQVNVNVNGLNYTNFTFNLSNNSLAFPLTLIEGVNVVVVTGTNAVGVDSETTTIIYRKPTQQVLPPVVSFILPAVSPETAYVQSYNLTARVKYVQSAANIVLKINGVATTNFTYQASSEMMNFGSTLITGANVFEITATNASGQDIASTTIIYRPVQQTLAPTVTLVTPSFCPKEVNSSTYGVQAIVLNVANSNEISVTLNGVAVTNFTYNAITHQLSFVANLVSGNNPFVITATNNGGSDTETCTIVYKPIEVVKPLVTFINPAISGTVVNVPGFIMKAKVLNVDNKLQISVTKDGAMLNQADFSYNATAKEITYNSNLIQGNNVFVVTGTNAGGTSSASTNIIYKMQETPCLKASVLIINPASPSVDVTTNTITVTANISNLTAANQLETTLNGVLLSSGVNFNVNTGVVTVTVDLTQGQNIVEFTAKNACSTGKGIVKINYKKEVEPCNNPTIQRILPLNDGNVENAGFLYKAQVNNVSDANQLTLTLNNVGVASSFDQATGIITANLTLTSGNNAIKLQASNKCGSVSNMVTINYRPCVAPTLSLVGPAAQSRVNSTTASNILLTGNIGGTSANAQVSVTLNGSPITFVYNEATHIITITSNLVIGVNTFVVTVSTPCGNVTQQYVITRENVVQVAQPTVVIITPSQSGTVTDQSSFLAKAITSNVNAQNQISVTVNGNQSNFNFEPSQNSITFNANLQDGNNVFVVTVTNAAGNASDTKTILYRKRIERMEPPTINFTSPNQNPIMVPPGLFNVVGTVYNVNAVNQVEIKVNGAVLNAFNPSFNGNQMSFQFPVSLDASNPTSVITVTATNATAQANETRVINVINRVKPIDIKPTNGKPTDGKPTEVDPVVSPKPDSEKPRPGGGRSKPVENVETPTKPAETPAPAVKGKRGGGND